MKRKIFLALGVVLFLLLVGCAYFEFCNTSDYYCYNNEKGLPTCVAVKYDYHLKLYYRDSCGQKNYVPAGAKIEHSYPVRNGAYRDNDFLQR